MDIFTCYDSESAEKFCSLKRRTKGEWEFLISGEWSETAYHQGNMSFLIRGSEDKCRWTLMRNGFPNKILAVVSAEEPCQLEVAGAQMMRALKKGGHESIDLVHEFGDIDTDLLWDTYRQR